MFGGGCNPYGGRSGGGGRERGGRGRHGRGRGRGGRFGGRRMPPSPSMMPSSDDDFDNDLDNGFDDDILGGSGMPPGMTGGGMRPGGMLGRSPGMDGMGHVGSIRPIGPTRSIGRRGPLRHGPVCDCDEEAAIEDLLDLMEEMEEMSGTVPPPRRLRRPFY